MAIAHQDAVPLGQQGEHVPRAAKVFGLGTLFGALARRVAPFLGRDTRGGVNVVL